MLTIGPLERGIALQAARAAISWFLAHGEAPEHSADAPSLRQLRGSFVTLRRRDTGELRGCRGECRPMRPLIESVIQEAISSATRDPRFPCVRAEELSTLSIRISALSPLTRIQEHEIVLGRHGLVVVQGRRSGLLLPEVPAHFGMRTTEEYLEILYRKARLRRDEISAEAAELYAFETEAWGDEELS